MNLTEFLVAAAIAIGIIGIVVPILPGSLLIVAAVLVWAIIEASPVAWIAFIVSTLFIAVGAVIKFTIPSRHLKASGVPNSTLLIGAALGFAGFFVVPVIGLFLGFILGIYLAEVNRIGAANAWPSTKSAVRAVGTSMLIEFVAGSLAAFTWLLGANLN